MINSQGYRPTPVILGFLAVILERNDRIPLGIMTTFYDSSEGRLLIANRTDRPDIHRVPAATSPRVSFAP